MKIELKDGGGRWVSADLLNELTPANLEEIAGWKPRLKEIMAPDSHWDWSKLYEKAVQWPLQYRMWVILQGGSVQGLCLLNLESRCRNDRSLHNVYVERVSSAPQNRGSKETRRFRPIGRHLIRRAVLDSVAEESFGRIGLHALEEAAPWYRDRLEMQSFGFDQDHHGLEYFEFNEAQAARFLGAEAVDKLRLDGRQVYPIGRILSLTSEPASLLRQLRNMERPLFRFLADSLSPKLADMLKRCDPAAPDGAVVDAVLGELHPYLFGSLAGTTLKHLGTARFSGEDFEDPAALFSKLRLRVCTVSAFVHERLSDTTRGHLGAWEISTPPSSQLRESVAADLNLLLDGEVIWRPDRFEAVSLRPETSVLLESNPTDGQVVRLNRLLLEDAYPVEIRRNPFSVI